MTMTRRKALKTLTLARKVIANDWKQPIGTSEALDMAIEALQEVDELEKIIKELADEDYQRQLWRDYKSLL